MSPTVTQQRSLADLGLTQLFDAFPTSAVRRGKLYADQRRVWRVDLDADGAALLAETWGSAPRPYHQRLSLAPGAPGAGIGENSCTCPLGGDCKHVVAAFLEAFRTGLLRAPEQRAERQVAVPGSTTALPAAIAAWLDDLGRSAETESETYPDSVRQRLIYVANAGESSSGDVPALDIACFTSTLRKDGSLGKPRRYHADRVASPAAYLRPSDNLILRRLAEFAAITGRAPGAEGLDLLQRIVATGRAYWGSLDGPPLHIGPRRAARVVWQLDSEGCQRPWLETEDGLLACRFAGPRYVDPINGEIGALDVGLADTIVERVLAAPKIPAALVPAVAESLTRRLPGRPVPAPAELPAPEILRGPAVPHLELGTLRLPVSPWRQSAGWDRVAADVEPIPVARLCFDYGPIRLPYGGGDAAGLKVSDGKLFQVVRHAESEAAALRRLCGLGLAPAVEALEAHVVPRAPSLGNVLLLDDDQEDVSWLDLIADEFPALRHDGWCVETTSDFPIQVVEPDGELAAEWREGSGIDWFELHLGVMVDGEPVDLVPVLTRLLDEGYGEALLETAGEMSAVPIPLTDGRLLMLPAERLRSLVAALLDLFAGAAAGSAEGRLRLHRLDATDLVAFEERSGLAWAGAESVRALGQALRAAGGAIAPVAPPAGFTGRLRPYQADGVAWLQFLRASGLGGVLADDMGLGKTVQTLAHLVIEKAEGRLDRPALVICPTSLVPNWTSEAARFAPELRLLALHGPSRRRHFNEIDQHDLVLTTYPLLARDHAVLGSRSWRTVILDEAQMIRNPNAETTRQVARLQAGHRLCLSGTPLQNHLGELWSLFDFLAPGFLGDARSFRQRYRTPIEKHGDLARQSALVRRVRPFLLRRTKEQVATDLPDKTEITERIELASDQRAIYDSVRVAMHKKVRAAIAARGLARSSIVILEALLRMRQACCDPRLLNLASTRGKLVVSAKLERLMDMLAMMRDEGRRVLLFSQFTSMLALIAERLDAARLAYVTLTGETADRAAPVRRFQDGEVPLFLCSLKAGGVGLNLTAADTVIHYDPWWNPAAEDQATDRAHRIGQTRHVFVYRLITASTIEAKMEELKARKRRLVAAVLDAQDGRGLQLTEADIDTLFEPA